MLVPISVLTPASAGIHSSIGLPAVLSLGPGLCRKERIDTERRSAWSSYARREKTPKTLRPASRPVSQPAPKGAGGIFIEDLTATIGSCQTRPSRVYAALDDLVAAVGLKVA
jgi:hypothetical protein